jgi:hypothetical protein
MRHATLILVCAGLALAACSEPSSLPTEPEAAAPLFTVNTTTGDPQAGTSTVFPSTNETNLGNGWAHVLFVDVAVGQVTLEFVQPRTFAACFEYRIDDEDPIDPNNFNSEITDGLWNYSCQNASSEQMTFSAADHVDIRMGFGAEGDERFDWTRFYVLSLENKDECKNGDWEALGFKNQGQCVRFVETGKDSRNEG